MIGHKQNECQARVAEVEEEDEDDVVVQEVVQDEVWRIGFVAIDEHKEESTAPEKQGKGYLGVPCETKDSLEPVEEKGGKGKEGIVGPKPMISPNSGRGSRGGIWNGRTEVRNRFSVLASEEEKVEAVIEEREEEVVVEEVVNGGNRRGGTEGRWKGGGKQGGKEWKRIGRGWITVDSGAEESVWPVTMLPEIPIEECPERKFVAANGSKLKHYGKKRVHFVEKGEEEGQGGGVKGMEFQVTDCQRPLASVARMVENGNKVVFGGDHGKSYVENKATGRRVPLKKVGGSYVMEVVYLGELVGRSVSGGMVDRKAVGAVVTKTGF